MAATKRLNAKDDPGDYKCEIGMVQDMYREHEGRPMDGP